MTKYDKIFIGIVLTFALLSCLMFFTINQNQTSLKAQISVNGEIFSTIYLNKSTPHQLIEVSGPLGTSVIEVRPDSVRMKSSPCPDHYCIKTGWIDRPGSMIVCAPNRIVIEIVPDENSIDTIAR